MSESDNKADAVASSRRTVLRFGAAAIPAFATLKASPAAAAASALTCTIPLTLSSTGSKWIKPDGSMVNANTSGSYPPLSTNTPAYGGQELRIAYSNGTRANSGKTLSNGQSDSNAAYDAHVEYIKKLTYGKPGYTCYASLYTSLS